MRGLLLVLALCAGGAQASTTYGFGLVGYGGFNGAGSVTLAQPAPAIGHADYYGGTLESIGFNISGFGFGGASQGGATFDDGRLTGVFYFSVTGSGESGVWFQAKGATFDFACCRNTQMTDAPILFPTAASAPIPEPSAWALLLAGLGLVGAHRIRRW